MNRLEKAMSRLNLALGMLETKLSKGSAGIVIPAAVAEELRALTEERVALTEEIERLKSEARAMEDFTEQVSGRVDGAIRDIQSVLQH